MKGECCIVGYGNPQRGDDGIGPFVARGLAEELKGAEGVRILSLHQLDPDLIEELGDVQHLILVDASARGSEKGVEWQEVEPDLRAVPPLTHHVAPAFLLGLVNAMHGRRPRAWMVSIEGEDFGLGEGLSLPAESRALRAMGEIVRFVRSGGPGEGSFPGEEDAPGKGDAGNGSLALGG